MSGLRDERCIPCEGKVRPLSQEEYLPYLNQLKDWTVDADTSIKKDFKFKDFAEALQFVNEVGVIAEQEGHHPDILIHGWNKVTITLSTHAIHGLSKNDFIVAAKIDSPA